MGQGNIVVFSFGTFFGKVFSKDRIPVADVLGCVVKGMSQVARATFFHVSVTVCEFSGLVCRWRAANISKNLVRRTEIGEIPDFCEDHSGGVYSYARNRKNRRVQFIHDLLNGIFDFVNLGGEFLNEFNGMITDLKTHTIPVPMTGKEAHAICVMCLIKWKTEALKKAS